MLKSSIKPSIFSRIQLDNLFSSFDFCDVAKHGANNRIYSQILSSAHQRNAEAHENTLEIKIRARKLNYINF